MASLDKILVVAPPTPPGVASLAQCLRDVRRDGLHAAWLCHDAWTQPSNFWTKTLAELDRNPDRLPIFDGAEGALVKNPREWMVDGYRLVIAGIAYEVSRDGGAHKSRRRSLRLLHQASRPARPVLYLERHAGNRIDERRPGRARIVAANHQSACRLHNTDLHSPLGKLAAVANLAFEESRCKPVWMKRARGLIARLQTRGKWDTIIAEAVKRLCRLDWEWLEEASIPDLASAQQGMVVLRHSILVTLEGLRPGWRLHGLNDAMQAAGRPYSVGVQKGRGQKLRLQVVRYWKDRRFPSVTTRLGSLAHSIAWAFPTDDVYYSPWLTRDDLLDLLNEVLEALEKDRGQVEAVARQLSGQVYPCDHPASLLLEAKERPTAPSRMVEIILKTYRIAMFDDVHPETWHHLKGHLDSGLVTPEPEKQRDFLERVFRFLRDSQFPWPARVLGATEAQSDLEVLQDLSQASDLIAESEKAVRLLDILGGREEEVGSLRLRRLNSKGESLGGRLVRVEQRGGVRTIIWPPTLSEMLEKCLHNMARHGLNKASHPWGLVASYFHSQHQTAFVTRHNGPALAEPAASVIEATRRRGHGGLEFLMRQVQHYRGTGWIRDVKSGSDFSGKKVNPLLREWILVGQNPPLGSAPAWLRVTCVPDLTTGLDLAERSQPGRFDGFIFGHPDDRDLMGSQTWDRLQRWKWSQLPRILLTQVENLGPLERYLPFNDLIDTLAQEPGVEVGWHLPALPT